MLYHIKRCCGATQQAEVFEPERVVEGNREIKRSLKRKKKVLDKQTSKWYNK